MPISLAAFGSPSEALLRASPEAAMALADGTDDAHCCMLTTADAERWRSALPANVSVMGSLEYVRFCEKQTGGSGRLFVVAAPEPVVAYPFLVRPVHGLPFAHDIHEPHWDTYSPQYTGPIALAPWSDSARFAELFGRFCRAQRIIAEFAHLNPWRVPAEHLEPTCVAVNREIVYVDLTQTEGEILTKSLTSDCRRQVNQGRQAGVRIRRAETAADIDKFHQLHTHTMERRQAFDRYYYPPGHFQDVVQSMPGHAFIVLAEYQERVVAGGLFLQDDSEIVWELSAADMDFGKVRPVNLYLYETIIAASREGKKRMILGGGYQPGDGVFKFKTNFSPLRASFSTYRRVHDADTYAALEKSWTAHNAGTQPEAGFFPSYRAAVRKS